MLGGFSSSGFGLLIGFANRLSGLVFWVLPVVAGGFGLILVMRRYCVVVCSGSRQKFRYPCPTSQSKGLPAIPACKVSFFHR